MITLDFNKHTALLIAICYFLRLCYWSWWRGILVGNSRSFQVPGYVASTQIPETQGAYPCPPVGRSPHHLQRAWLVGGHSQAAVLLSKDDGRKSVVLERSGSNPQKNETPMQQQVPCGCLHKKIYFNQLFPQPEQGAFTDLGHTFIRLVTPTTQ